MQVGDVLPWYHIWDYYPPPHAPIFVHVFIVLFPYMDDVLVLFLGLYGGRIGGMCVPHGMEALFLCFATYFMESRCSAMFVSMAFLTPYGMDHEHLIMILERQLMGGWIGEHSAYSKSLIFDDVTNGGEALHHSPYQLLEDKKHFRG